MTINSQEREQNINSILSALNELKMVIQLAMILNVDVEEIIEKLIQSDQTSKQLLAILKEVVKFKDNDPNEDKTATLLALYS